MKNKEYPNARLEILKQEVREYCKDFNTVEYAYLAGILNGLMDSSSDKYLDVLEHFEKLNKEKAGVVS